MTHFYLTLPSNSSDQFYPDNTLTKYTTRLQSTIELDGAWEVGLSEIIFPRSWLALDDKSCKFVVTCDKCNDIDDPDFTDYKLQDELSIPHGYYDSVESVVEAINNTISNSYKLIPRPEGGFPEYPQYRGNVYLINGVRRVHPGIYPKLDYEQITKKVRFYLAGSTGIEFTPVLANILGLGKHQNPLINYSPSFSLKEYGERVCDIAAGINSLYVYCDVLEHVPVGDTKAPLLRIVEAKASTHEVIHMIYDKPRYLPLQKKNFDSIEIDIRNCFGEKISFENGQVVVILEFNRAKNPYFL